MPEPDRLQSVRGARLVGPLVWAAARLRLVRWDALLANRRRLRDAQERTLLGHVRAAERTSFGRAHGFDRIRGHEDFSRRVPVRNYADLEPYFERMRRGERDVLHPGFIEHWGQSSGTSQTAANVKLLPLSDAQIRWQQRAAFDVVARYVTAWGDRGFPGGHLLGLFPPSTITRSGPVGITNNPGLMQLHTPRVARRIQLPRAPIRDIPSYEQKLAAMAEAYLDHDVHALSGTTCWFSVFFDHLITAARRRGRRPSCIADLWPNLRVLLGGGVPAEPYRALVEARVGRPIALIETYSATEGGFFATTDSRSDPAMRMIPDRGVFFELVPRSELGTTRERRVPLWDAEPGVDYSVVLTTSSGLFAYAIGDFIRFDQTFPHRMQFVGRAAGVLSLTQELTTTLELERAVGHAARTSGCTLVDFAVSSEVGVAGTAKGRYVVFLELERGTTDLERFGRAFDQALCEQNRVYREHRADDVAILAPLVLALAPGATQRFMQDLGQTSAQQKFPRILGSHATETLRRYVRP